MPAENATTYAAGYQAYKFGYDNLNNMFPAARSSFPEVGREKLQLQQEKVCRIGRATNSKLSILTNPEVIQWLFPVKGHMQ